MIESTENFSDQYVLQQIALGKEEVFDFLFRKYYRQMCFKSEFLIKDQDAAQEIVQLCFIKFWERRKELTEIKEISGFLSTMVRNKSIDYLRKDNSKKTTVEDLKYSEQEYSQDNMAFSTELEEVLMEAILQLPPRCREAFEYSRFEGMTYAQIAKKMNISQKAVEALMARSLKILRSELVDYLPLLIFLNSHM
ncbi:MAG: RNA polymerase sigma-70 factor [Carboxylicivirga sp.]|jgi:RNA polymerase sigma-70 factor (ECF subfamily)|nr:RNA polymerase sigma-70 factor [Carboxylicivirga sp.]